MRAGGHQGLKTGPPTLTIQREIEGLFRTRLSNHISRGQQERESDSTSRERHALVERG